MAKDGGQAFPVPAGNFSGGESWCPSDGMSLRDYFAGQALSQAIAHERELRTSQIAPGEFRYEAIAHAAYVIADAMLTEREK